MMETKVKVVVPWHDEGQLRSFLSAWKVDIDDRRLVLSHDAHKDGCAITKNKGIETAYNLGADIIIVLDDDCYPSKLLEFSVNPFHDFIDRHVAALLPQQVQIVYPITDPPSRGTPYRNNHMLLPVAASLGFWEVNPDFDAVRTLASGGDYHCIFNNKVMFQQMFPFCGMNFAFKRIWWRCAQLIDVPRFDDIWMGWIWQKIAYANNRCFNLRGPNVKHVRQSNVWKNLKEEAENLERNETIWVKIFQADPVKYDTPEKLRKLISV